MRIIAGEFARRRIQAPPGKNTRPTTDRVREALFQHLVSARLDAGFHKLAVLDLYAGSGALGLEALSRGARCVTFVESARPALRALRANIDALGCGERTTVVAGALPSSLRRCRTPVDVVLADPPYADAPLEGLAGELERTSLVAAGALLVYEHNAGRLVVAPEGWRDEGERRWGDTAVTFLRRT